MTSPTTLDQWRQHAETHGGRVRYVPNHAHGDRGHADCEDGRISSIGTVNVFVRFDKRVARLGWEGTTAEACDPESLVAL
jgi:hypothetical protein